MNKVDKLVASSENIHTDSVSIYRCNEDGWVHIAAYGSCSFGSSPLETMVCSIDDVLASRYRAYVHLGDEQLKLLKRTITGKAVTAETYVLKTTYSSTTKIERPLPFLEREIVLVKTDSYPQVDSMIFWRLDEDSYAVTLD